MEVDVWKASGIPREVQAKWGFIYRELLTAADEFQGRHPEMAVRLSTKWTR
jgi:hypothetical protein